MTKTNIKVDSSQKKVHIFVAGRMTAADANAFVTEYQTKMRAINGAEYELYVDCTDMEVLTPEMADSLQEVMKMYKATGFKKILCKAKNSVLKMQISRLARNTMLQQLEVTTV